MLTPDRAEFFALWVETLLYGIFFSYFLQSIGLLTWKRSGARINLVLIFVSLSIFALATTHLILVLCRSQQAFIFQRDAPGGPIAYWSNLQSGLEVSQASSQTAISIIGDGMVIYRVWVVYNRNYKVLVLPILSFIGTTVCSIASVIYIGKASAGANVFYLPKLEIWLPAFFGMTFATSVLCSALIAGRLWYIHKWVHISRTTNTLTTVLRIVIESASIYALTMLLYLGTYVAKKNVSIIFGDMVSPVIGIAFSLITIRVHNAFNPDTYNSDLDTSDPAYIQKHKDHHREGDGGPRPALRYIYTRGRRQHPGNSVTVSAGPLSDPQAFSVSLGEFPSMAPNTTVSTGTQGSQTDEEQQQHQHQHTNLRELESGSKSCEVGS